MIIEQLSFLSGNGYIKPCPYTDICNAFKLSNGIRPDGSEYIRGCDGACYWCGHYDKKKNTRHDTAGNT